MAEWVPPPDDDRSVELSAIEAIFPEIKISPSSPFKASLDIPVIPSAPITVLFEQANDRVPPPLTPPTSLEASDNGVSGDRGGVEIPVETGPDMHLLSYLPPLTLDIELPEGYPSQTPPIFYLSTTPPWLPAPQRAKLLADGQRLWEGMGRDAVVYTYIDHLRQLTENAFDLADTPGAEVRLPRNLKIALLDFDIKAKRESFEQGTFECGVCLEPKKGVNCHRLLLCSHVFCIPCLQDFYNACITEGEVDNVRCLAPDCGQDPSGQADPSLRHRRRKKKDRTLSPSELLQIPLEQETVQRYVFLKRKRRLEADRTTVYCPRKWCQGAARSKRHPKPSDPLMDDVGDSDGEEEENVLTFDPQGEESQLPPVADRVAICEDCGYAFCCVCMKGWHGELVRCYPRREAELSAEEKASEEYLQLYTTPCPTCTAPCQKRMGCNHMICFKCGTHFCYLCSAWLAEDNPYKHFNTSESSCFNRLWDLEGGDGINPEGPEALHAVPDDQFEFGGDPDLDEDDVDRNADDNHPWELESNDSDDDNDDDDDDDSDDDDDDDDDSDVYDDSHDDSDDDGGNIHWRRPPPPPAPIPPRVIPIDHAHPNQWRDARGLDAAGRAAAAERHAQALAMAQVRVRPVAHAAVRRQQGIHYIGGV